MPRSFNQKLKILYVKMVLEEKSDRDHPMHTEINFQLEKAGEDAGFVTGLYDSVKSYTVTNMGNDIFAKLLAASQNGITDTETVPGEGTHGENFDEYHIDEDALSDLIISMFYEKI